MFYNEQLKKLNTIRRFLQKPLETDLLYNLKKINISVDRRLRYVIEKIFDRAKQQVVLKKPKILTQLKNRYTLYLNQSIEIPGIKMVSAFQVVEIPEKERKHYLLLNTQKNIDRIYDYFQLTRCGYEQINDEDIFSLVKLFILSEAIALYLLGVADLKIKGICNKEIIFYPRDHESERWLKRKWFAYVWEQYSSLFNMRLINKMTGYIKLRRSCLTNYEKRLFEEMVFYMLDKVFSINYRHINNTLKQSEIYKNILQIVKFNLLLLLAEASNFELKKYDQIFRLFGVEKAFLENLYEQQERMSIVDRCVEIKDDYVRPSKNYSGMAMRSSIANQLYDLGEKQKGRWNKTVGNWFEQYIKQYLKNNRDYQGNYRIYDGFRLHDVHPEKLKGDVDLIIHDINRQMYFFVQIKYKQRGGMAYLQGDVEACIGLRNGLVQLREVRRALEEGKLDCVFKEMNLKGVSVENSRFILLHNIYNLDFQITSDGIVLYEWNTFRNLLRKGRVVYSSNNKSEGQRIINMIMPIECPDSVIEIYKHDPLLRKALIENDIARKLQTEFMLEGRNIVLMGLGI